MFVGGYVGDVVEGIYVVATEVDIVGFPDFRLRVGFFIKITIVFSNHIFFHLLQCIQTVSLFVIIVTAIHKRGTTNLVKQGDKL